MRVAERLALLTSDHGVAGSNPAGGEILPEPKRRFIAQSLSCSPFHRLEMTEILLKGRKTLTHPSILTGCSTHHALRPYIDSEINHQRHFIKIPFINKEMEFISLHSIHKDTFVTSVMPAYLKNTEAPILCYRYNKSFRTIIFNFNNP